MSAPVQQPLLSPARQGRFRRERSELQPLSGVLYVFQPGLFPCEHSGHCPQADELLGAGKWATGPTGVVVLQGSGWTVGVLAWHNWSFAGDADRADVNETFLQPVLAYTTSRAWTFTLQGEDTYNWETGEWLAPVNFLVSKIVKVGGQPVSIVGGVRYWMDSPDTGPHGFGGRLGMTFLFPAR